MKLFLYALLFLIAAPSIAPAQTTGTDTPPPAPAITGTTTIPALPGQAVELQKTTPTLETPNSVAELMLTRDSDVNDADKVSLVIDQMRNNVRACIRTNQGTADECQCKFPNNLTNLQTAYDSALRLHPDWDGKMISFKKGTAPTESVSFGGLKAHLAACEQREKTK